MSEQQTISLKCFNCKDYKTLSLIEGSVRATRNNRRVVTGKCPDCTRTITSLIKTEVGDKFLKPLDQLQNDRHPQSDQSS